MSKINIRFGATPGAPDAALQELSVAREKPDGTTFPSLRGRLDELDSSLAQKATKSTGIINVKDYQNLKIAVADGYDWTPAFQKAVDDCLVGGKVTGDGGTYLVSSIRLKSNMDFIDCFLNTLGGSTDLVSPVTIDGSDGVLKENINIERVRVNGQRSKQTNIGTTEDGGRHGFRILGLANNITIDKCMAIYCASDGIELFSAGTKPQGMAANAAAFNNIIVKNSIFNWNRRHGGSADSINNVTFDNCTFNYNGRDINGGVVEGDKGDLLGGSRYGNGFDIEGYGVRSSLSNLTFINCEAIQNVRSGILFYDPTTPNTVGFTVRTGIKLINCHLDGGTEPIDNGAALTFTPVIANKALGISYQNIDIQNCTIEGNILLRSCDRVTVDGGSIINAWTYAGVFDYTTNVHVGSTQLQGKTFFTDTSTVKYLAKTDTIGTLSVPQQSFVKINLNTAQNFVADTNTLVQFNGTEIDTQGEYSTSTYRFTAKTTGVFLINSNLGFATQIANNVMYMYIYKNGGYFGLMYRQAFTSTVGNQVNATYMIKLVAGDYIEIRFKSLNAITCQTGYDLSYLNITKLS